MALQVEGSTGVLWAQGRVIEAWVGAVAETSSIQYWVEQLSQVDGLL